MKFLDTSPGVRSAIIRISLLVIIILYGFQLVQLQVIHHTEFDAKASMNSLKPDSEIPLRGVFYDRNLNILVHNEPSYSIEIIPANYDTLKNTFLDSLFHLPAGTVSKTLAESEELSRANPIRICGGIDFATIGWLEENWERFPGVSYKIEMKRIYSDTIMPAHMYGYLREINQKQLAAESNYYDLGDLIGQSGLERSYEKLLRGAKGVRYHVVDSRKREVFTFENQSSDKPSIKGADLVLSLDINAQKTAEQELRGRVGAVVAIDPATGEILAMASSPTFDVSEFSAATSKDYFNSLLQNDDKPLFNRATMAAHPPGSTFKVLCAMIALEKGIITPYSTLYCGGGFNFGRFYKCHGAHGSINVIHAIEESCNSFFYQLIFKIGLDTLAEYAKRFGFGVKSGIDLLESSAGFIPTEKYYERMYGKNWGKGMLVSLGIGQGEISITPLQLAFFTALIANNGHSYKPHLAKGTLGLNKKIEPMRFIPVDVGFSQRTFDVVKRGMFLVVNGSGTAKNIRRSDIQIAGKTGTAQNPHGRDHSIFIGFAPYDQPKIAVAVLVENAGFGARYAAPIAQKVMLSYLYQGQIPQKYSGSTVEKIGTNTPD